MARQIILNEGTDLVPHLSKKRQRVGSVASQDGRVVKGHVQLSLGSTEGRTLLRRPRAHGDNEVWTPRDNRVIHHFGHVVADIDA
jgi:hypothetical protein